MAYVELSNISKFYENGYHAAENVSIAIEKGEFVVLLGPSGCGKSTTLRMIAGLEKISSGELRIDNHVVNDVLPKYRDIAMVFQSYALYPHMSVYENMALSLKMKGIDKQTIKDQILPVAEMLHLTEFLDAKPSQLSGGQRQRVALGRAIVRRPKVFLFDEPLSNLDAKLRNKMRQEISALHKQINATIIYVTHDQIEAMTMADKVVIMNKGKVQQIGTPMELYHSPINRFVAEFIGAPQMNFFDVLVTEATTETNEPIWRLINDSGFTLALERSAFPFLSKFKDLRVDLGCRPENCLVAPSDDSSTLHADFIAELAYIENLGAEMNLFVSLNDENQYIIKHHEKISPSIGEKIGVVLDKQTLHFFDQQTGERIN